MTEGNNVTSLDDGPIILSEEDEGKLSEAIDILVLAFRAIEFMGTHSLAIAYGRGCNQCTNAAYKQYKENLTPEEMIDLLCPEAKKASKIIAAGRMVVELWETAGEEEPES